MNPSIPSTSSERERLVEENRFEQRATDYRTRASQIAEHIIHEQEVSVAAPIDLNAIDEFAVHAALFRWVREAADGLPEDRGDRQVAADKIIACWQAQQDNPESKAAKELNLSGLNLSRLPETIGLLTGLRVLNLSHNQLETLPRRLAKLQNLEQLNCNSNGFDDVPEVITLLPHLKRLEMTDNGIIHISETIRHARGLEWLDLSDNMLQHLPEGIGHLNRLRHLDLSTNMVNALPDSMGQLQQMEYFNCSDNELREFPSSIAELPKLRQYIKEGNVADRRRFRLPD